MTFATYYALGDSMSIDLYAALDAGLTDVSVALERIEGAGPVQPVGAAALFYQNADTLWPEEQGNDLHSQFPKLAYRRLAVDGATIGDVFGEQLPMIEETEEPALVTLTIGSEDLFSAFSARPPQARLERIVRDLGEAYDLLVSSIRNTLPNSTIMVTTVCDPSDQTGKIRGVLSDAGPLPLFAIDQFNAQVRRMASGQRDVALADAFALFLGHGVTAEEADRWFWRRSPIEINSRGASELRLLWLQALRETLAG